MSNEKSLVARGYDAVEGAVGPHLNQLMRTERFADIVALATTMRAKAKRGAGNVTARLWHALNLPAGTDIARLRSSVGSLDHDVRRLAMRIEAAGPTDDD